MPSQVIFLDALQWLGMALLHFLWQGLLIGVAYVAVRSLLPRGTARYRLGLMALVALFFCPVLTLVWMSKATLATTSDVAFDAAGGATGSLDQSPISGLEWTVGSLGIASWLSVFWLAGVLVLSIRVWRQWHGLRGLIDAGIEDDGSTRCMLTRLAERFGLHRHISLVWSDSIHTPLLAGWLRPVIVMPLAMASGFPPLQLELVLAHELAHLKRLDPLINFFQVVLETLFFFHPVVRLISADVRNEREICCDQMALAKHGGNWRDLARALSALGEMQSTAPMALAASGGVLLDRIHQMAAGENVRVKQPSRPYSGALLALGMVATLVLGLTLKREGVPDLIGPVPRVASLIMLPLAQSLHEAWQPADLKPLSAPMMRPLQAPTNVLEELSLPLPSVGRELVLPKVPSMVVANLAQRSEALLPIYQQTTEKASPALTPLRIRQPVYPPAALERGVEGRVVIEFGLAANGSVKAMRVVSAVPSGVFEQAALAAMRDWIYSVPPHGPRSERYKQVMIFSLDGDDINRGDREIQASFSCQVMTGTHICRKPEEAMRHLAVENSTN